MADSENSELREILAIPSVYESSEQISDFRQTIKSSLEGLLKKENKITNPQKYLLAHHFFCHTMMVQIRRFWHS